MGHCSLFLVDSVGRRPLMVAGGGLCAVALARFLSNFEVFVIKLMVAGGGLCAVALARFLTN